MEINPVLRHPHIKNIQCKMGIEAMAKPPDEPGE
jgi:hypothetical protein